MFWKSHRVALSTYQAGLLQSQAYRALSLFMTERLHPYGLSMPDWAALGIVKDAGRLRLSELAMSLQVKPPVATKLVNELEAMGLISREPTEEDSRVSMLALTAKGQDVATTVERGLRTELRAYLEDIPLPELMIYLRVLKKLAAKLPH